MKVKQFSLRILITFLFVINNVITFAQPPGGPPPGGVTGAPTGAPPCWQPECIPIDGGILFLLIGGIMLGAFTIYSRKNRSRA